MRIGVFGGSFDPIHNGHAILANFTSQCGIVDEVWLMVSRKNPLKDKETQASEIQRLEMAEMVAMECKNVKISDFEMTMPSPSFTIDTLNALKEKYPEHQFVWIIGSDSLKNFSNWKNSEEIKNKYGLIVYPRPGYPLIGREPDGMTYLNGAPEFSISSTLIREYVADGWNINYFVPLKVGRYISKNNLYKNGNESTL